MAQRHALQEVTDRSELHALEKAVKTFASAREWEQFHDPKNLTMALASECGELCAVLRWIASEESDRAVRTEPLHSALLSEIGDVAVLLLLLCERVGTHLDAVVLAKLETNALKYPIDKSKGRPEMPIP